MRKPQPVTVGVYVKDGKLKVPSRAVLLAAVKHWPSGAYEMTLSPFESRRRVRQNNAYWRALGEAEKLAREDCGWTKDEWHVYFAQKYNGKVLSDTDPKTGEIIEVRVGLTTTKLSVEDFSVYLDHVLFEIADRYGVVIEFKDEAA